MATFIESTTIQGVPMAMLSCSCGMVFYTLPHHAEIASSCGHEKAAINPGRLIPPKPKMSIRKRAYYLWEEAGRPHGRADEFWLQAERQSRSLLR